MQGSAAEGQERDSGLIIREYPLRIDVYKVTSEQIDALTGKSDAVQLFGFFAAIAATFTAGFIASLCFAPDPPRTLYLVTGVLGGITVILGVLTCAFFVQYRKKRELLKARPVNEEYVRPTQGKQDSAPLSGQEPSTGKIASLPAQAPTVSPSWSVNPIPRLAGYWLRYDSDPARPGGSTGMTAGSKGFMFVELSDKRAEFLEQTGPAVFRSLGEVTLKRRSDDPTESPFTLALHAPNTGDESHMVLRVESDGRLAAMQPRAASGPPIYYYLRGRETDAAPGQGAGVEILRADYGIPGIKQQDVAKALGGATRWDRLLIHVTDDPLGCDPVPGKLKRLELDYRHRGQEHALTVDQGDWLHLPPLIPPKG